VLNEPEGNKQRITGDKKAILRELNIFERQIVVNPGRA
jgi:hypothetical protein